MSYTKAEIRKQFKAHVTNKITFGEWDAYRSTVPTELWREVVKSYIEAERRLRIYKNTPRFKNKIRKYCNYFGYTDIHPYEVVKVISDKTVHIRQMAAELLNPKDLHFEVGGFAGTCVNQHIQRYQYTSNEDNPIKTLRLGKNGWGGGKYQMSDEPCKFYDYKF